MLIINNCQGESLLRQEALITKNPVNSLAQPLIINPTDEPWWMPTNGTSYPDHPARMCISSVVSKFPALNTPLGSSVRSQDARGLALNESWRKLRKHGWLPPGGVPCREFAVVPGQLLNAAYCFECMRRIRYDPKFYSTDRGWTRFHCPRDPLHHCYRDNVLHPRSRADPNRSSEPYVSRSSRGCRRLIRLTQSSKSHCSIGRSALFQIAVSLDSPNRQWSRWTRRDISPSESLLVKTPFWDSPWSESVCLNHEWARRYKCRNRERSSLHVHHRFGRTCHQVAPGRASEATKVPRCIRRVIYVVELSFRLRA